MPFDGTEKLSRLECLSVLREILGRQTHEAQLNWKTCLLGEARRDARLSAIGMPPFEMFGAFDYQASDTAMDRLYAFLGLKSCGLFSCQSVAEKEAQLDALIADERAKAELLTQG